jgi:hypothetical protein
MRGGYDFTDSQCGAIVKSNKERITTRFDPDIIEWVRGRVRGGGNYQILIKEVLREHMERPSGTAAATAPCSHPTRHCVQWPRPWV